MLDLPIKWAPIISENCVLVGAFCKIGDADTGKPVQNYVLFVIFGAFLEI